jgi:hypothetical protein
MFARLAAKIPAIFPEEARAFLDHIPVSPDAASSDRTTRDGVNSTN